MTEIKELDLLLTQVIGRCALVMNKQKSGCLYTEGNSPKLIGYQLTWSEDYSKVMTFIASSYSEHKDKDSIIVSDEVLGQIIYIIEHA